MKLSNPLKPEIFLKLGKLKFLVYILYFCLFLSVIYHLSFAHRIIPGVRVGNVSIGGKTYDEAKKSLADYEGKQNKNLTLKLDDKTVSITGTEINLKYNWDDTIIRAFEVGRTGNFLSDSKEKIVGLFKPLWLPAFYDYEDDILSAKLSFIKAETNVQMQDAGFSMDETGKLKITQSKEGKKILDDVFGKVVMNSFDNIDFSEKNIPTKVVPVKVSEQDIVSLTPQVEKLVTNKILVTHKDKKWELTGTQLLDLITLYKDGSKVSMKMNEPKFDAFSQSIAQDVNTLPRGQVTKSEGNKVLEFKLTKDGEEMDVPKFSDKFEKALFSSLQTVEIPMKAVTGPADKEKYGILELLGEGVSTFKGSIQGRINNIALASERTNGVLVEPGGVYSLGNSIGDVDSTTGYDMAYIIKGDRTVLGAGGGVCQVSTTVFRAVLNAGLPVVMRFPHAYRVGYYEQNMPVGFDAAVFLPSWDFKFKNDTPNYILVQNTVDLNTLTLTFRIYGTPDGRTVEISKPEITAQVPPPAALYQDDPTIAKGTTIQVEHPAWGAKVKFTRTVKRGDNVLLDDAFTSNYTPWRAVFLVGTKK